MARRSPAGRKARGKQASWPPWAVLLTASLHFSAAQRSREKERQGKAGERWRTSISKKEAMMPCPPFFRPPAAVAAAPPAEPPAGAALTCPLHDRQQACRVLSGIQVLGACLLPQLQAAPAPGLHPECSSTQQHIQTCPQSSSSTQHRIQTCPQSSIAPPAHLKA